eukprot:4718317-Amphidinium_carterae.1
MFCDTPTQPKTNFNKGNFGNICRIAGPWRWSLALRPTLIGRCRRPQRRVITPCQQILDQACMSQQNDTKGSNAIGECYLSCTLPYS